MLALKSSISSVIVSICNVLVALFTYKMKKLSDKTEKEKMLREETKKLDTICDKGNIADLISIMDDIKKIKKS